MYINTLICIEVCATCFSSRFSIFNLNALKFPHQKRMCDTTCHCANGSVASSPRVRYSAIWDPAPQRRPAHDARPRDRRHIGDVGVGRLGAPWMRWMPWIKGEMGN